MGRADDVLAGIVVVVAEHVGDVVEAAAVAVGLSGGPEAEATAAKPSRV